MKRVLFCGEGHGAQAVFKGLCETGFHADVCSTDPVVLEAATQLGFRAYPTLETGILTAKDTVISAAYKPWIAKETLHRATFLNVHYALFPKYRGLHSLVWAMLNGEKHVGLTIHLMSDLLDAGPILHQEPVDVGAKTSWQLMEELDELARRRIGPVVNAFLDGEIKPREQNEAEATYCAKRNLEDCRVQWKEWDAVYFERVLKALVAPYPRPFFTYKDRRLEIHEAKVVHRYYREIPGHVVYIDNDSVWIKLTDGLLEVRSVMENGEIIPARQIFKMPGARLQ